MFALRSYECNDAPHRPLDQILREERVSKGMLKTLEYELKGEIGFKCQRGSTYTNADFTVASFVEHDNIQRKLPADMLLKGEQGQNQRDRWNAFFEAKCQASSLLSQNTQNDSHAGQLNLSTSAFKQLQNSPVQTANRFCAATVEAVVDESFQTQNVNHMTCGTQDLALHENLSEADLAYHANTPRRPLRGDFGSRGEEDNDEWVELSKNLDDQQVSATPPSRPGPSKNVRTISSSEEDRDDEDLPPILWNRAMRRATQKAMKGTKPQL